MDNDLPGSLCAAILAQSADAIVYADRDGWIRFWNAAAERMFGFPAGQVLGQSLDIFIPEHLRARHWAGYQRAMASGKTVHAGRPTLTKALHRSGTTLYVEMSFSVVSDPEQGTLGAVAIARAPD